jgi:indole-3-glycerol phosphate synthase
VQAPIRWIPPGGTLGRIVAEAELRAAELEARANALADDAEEALPGPSLERALRAGDTVSVLAEVKRRSPSRGAIAEGLDAVAQAQAYLDGGAAGVSVLTEPAHFGGSVDDLLAVRANVSIAALKKDFHVAPIQLVEARALGASAALVIARALSPERFREMMAMGPSLGLELLVEVRDEDELERALAAGATMIGVNNRDLETLVVDPATCDRLLPRIPAKVLAIAESGIASRADVERYAAAGADAVLVGSVLSSSADAAAAARALCGVPRQPRG